MKCVYRSYDGNLRYVFRDRTPKGKALNRKIGKVGKIRTDRFPIFLF